MNDDRPSPSWRRYLRFWGRDSRRDLDDELRFHLEARYDEYVAMGMEPVRARAEAERRFGDLAVVRDRCARIDSRWDRERTMSDLVSTIGGDIRFAWRQLRRSPSLSIAAILCFALGIGANTSIFSVVDAVLFRPLPFPESDRLVLVGDALPHFGGGNFGLISTPEYHDYRQLDGRTFERSAIFESASFTLSGAGGEPERVTSAAVSASVFDVLRVKAALGRTFLPGEDLVGGPNVAVLSDALWRRRFNADPLVIGRSVIINGVPSVIIGVMPAGFAFPLPGLGGDAAELFSPYWITPDIERLRGNSYNTSLIARLASGVTLARARREANEIAGRLPQMHPGAYGPGHTTVADVFSLHERAVGDVRRSLLVLLTAVGLVLLIACINVSSLLLARAASRHREVSVRRALGASRGRLVQQSLAESAVLVVIGGAMGVAFATWGARALATRAPRALLQGYSISVDGRVLLVTAAIAAITAIVISLLPAMQQADRGLAGSLRDEGSRRERRRGAGSSARRTLVASEIALAMIVATGTGLMVKSFLNARDADPGFAPDHLAGFRLGLAGPLRYPSSREVLQFEERMAERLRAIPGVQSASVASTIPMGGTSRFTFSIENRDLPTIPIATNTIVFPNYFSTMGIRLRAGHAFTGAETAQSPAVTIINETLAREFFPDANPIGRRIKWGSPTSPSPWLTIVGVAADVKPALDAPSEPTAYFVAAQVDTVLVTHNMRGAAYIVRAQGDPQSTFKAIRRAVGDEDSELPLIGLRPMTAVVEQSVATTTVQHGASVAGRHSGAAARRRRDLRPHGVRGCSAYARDRHPIGDRRHARRRASAGRRQRRTRRDRGRHARCGRLASSHASAAGAALRRQPARPRDLRPLGGDSPRRCRRRHGAPGAAGGAHRSADRHARRLAWLGYFSTMSVNG